MPLSDNTIKPQPFVSWLRNNKVAVFIGALVMYAFLTLLVLLYYPDDVEQMSWVDREVFNHKVISRYQLSDNLSQQQVIERLGSPDITAAVKVDNQIYQLLYYRTHRSAPDGITTADECTALLFKNRLLVAIGNDATARYHAVSVGQ